MELTYAPITLYALCVTVAMAVGLVMLGREREKLHLKSETTEIFALLALPLGLVFARLVYCLCRISLYLEIGLANILRLWDGGYSLMGAALGVVLAALLTARITKQSPLKILDAIAPPAALTIALCRFAELTNGQGVGPEVTQSFFQRFPFAVYDSEWEIWLWAVFMLEGIAGWIIALVLQSKRFSCKAGDRTKMFAVLFCASQIFFETLREDGYLRWLFVRITQLGAMVVLVGVMLASVCAWKKLPAAARTSTGKMIVSWIAFAACVGIDIWMQFAIQKSAEIPVWACYSIMGLCSLAFGIIAYQMIFKYQKAEK